MATYCMINLLPETGLHSVLVGNRLAARSALLWLLGAFKLAMLTLEQPDSSTMPKHPSWMYIKDLAKSVSWCHWYQTTTWMGAYGGKTPKGHILLSNTKLTAALARRKPKATGYGQGNAYKSYVRNGKLKVDGAKGLKGTENYTDAFGEAVHGVYANYTLATVSQDNFN